MMCSQNSSYYVCYQRANQTANIVLASIAAAVNLIFLSSIIKQRDIIKSKSQNAYVLYILLIAFVFSIASIVHSTVYWRIQAQVLQYLDVNSTRNEVEKCSSELMVFASFSEAFRVSLLVTTSLANCLLLCGLRLPSSQTRLRFYGTEHSNQKSRINSVFCRRLTRRKILVIFAVAFSWIVPVLLAVLCALGWCCNKSHCMRKEQEFEVDQVCSVLWFPMKMDFVIFVSCMWAFGVMNAFVVSLLALRRSRDSLGNSRVQHSDRTPCLANPSLKGSLLSCSLSYITSSLLVIAALVNDSKFSGIPIEVLNASYCGYQMVQPFIFLSYFDDIKKALRRSIWDKVYVEKPPVTMPSISTEPKPNQGFELLKLRTSRTQHVSQTEATVTPFLQANS